jgi:hypothetical protein
MTRAPDVEPNDPTRSGAPLPAGRDARLSRNEIEQLCLKAARGAGMSWGLAEEAGFAAAWVARRGLDGPSALLAQLRTSEGRPWREICPVVEAERFRAVEGGRLCPIALGSALCDHAALLDAAMEADGLRIGPVSNPILLVPFMSELSQARGETIRLHWSGGEIHLTPTGTVTGDTAALMQETSLEAVLSASKEPRKPDPTPDTPLIVPAHTLAALNAFAMRTTVPASAASRAGAGAAAGDND